MPAASVGVPAKPQFNAPVQKIPSISLDSSLTSPLNVSMDEKLKELLSGPSGAVLRYDVQSDSETVTMRPIHEIKDLSNLLTDCSQRQVAMRNVFRNAGQAKHYCD